MRGQTWTTPMEARPASFDLVPLPQMHIVTPCVLSRSLSDHVGRPVYLKLENLQPSGSFKIRGIGHAMRKAAKAGVKSFVVSSGGNAGLAAAHAARELGLPITVFLPTSTHGLVAKKLEAEGAHVQIHGRIWNEAAEKAQSTAEETGAFLVHPFDHPDVWKGHSSVIDELKDQLGEEPGLIVTCVGGGGLLLGIIEGLERVGWSRVPILCMETEGADCFNASVKAGHLVSIPDITSIAKCLGARKPAGALEKHLGKKEIISRVVSDKQALTAILRFADEHRMLVEPACGAALAGLYEEASKVALSDGKPIVVVLCGGSAVSLQLLQEWRSIVSQ
ncbi:unnamed protein product [Darwinula stevensoni]|uniref:L-serine ammonia-lyase n=1 Tax=Darwinula stevensoni TaxID=69355 RepID=A0A7R8XBR0_9CRUS|nr:unnamed protein product [Darwinula stevensoni]CAG0892638.1 unnamed protein product [Darwinula stevensoni]